MPEAVIVDAIRTPIGRAVKGSLKTVRADELAATPLRALIERNPKVNFAETGDVMMGAASSIGEQGYNVGRNASLLAGIDHHVPACTVNRFCASSLQTLRMAFPRDQGRRGRPVHRRRGRGRVARRARRRDDGGGQAPAAERLGGLGLRRLHPDGADRRERRRALPRHARAAGRMGRDLPESSGGGTRLRPLRLRDRAGHGPGPQGRRQGGQRDRRPRDGRRRRRRPAAGHDDGGAGHAQAGVQGGRDRDRRQLLPAQRRRRRRAGHVRGEGQAAGARAEGADPRLDRRRDPSRDHGARPDPGDPGAPQGDRA